MKYFFPFLLLFSIIGFSFTVSGDCGSYRWAVKTVTDNAADSILKLSPLQTSIGELLSEKRVVPDFLFNDTLRYNDEKRLVSVKAKLLKIKIGDDRDFHLVLLSSDGLLMVAEIPDGECSAFDNHPDLRKRFDEMRKQIIDAIGFTPEENLKNVEKSVVVEGIPFWDKIKEGHQPKYGSADKHEIHPVTKIIFN